MTNRFKFKIGDRAITEGEKGEVLVTITHIRISNAPMYEGKIVVTGKDSNGGIYAAEQKFFKVIKIDK